jgi:DNA-binding transcriptional MerR regulator
MADSAGKAEGAFRTIGELSRETGLPQHILRFWETRFSQLRPLQRAGNRRYYRPEDAALVRRIDQLLNHEGYTIRGVQQLLANEGKRVGQPQAQPPTPPEPRPETVSLPPHDRGGGAPIALSPSAAAAMLQVIRDHLAEALAEDAA